jgi:ubiquinone/menaquinone biosynthesis C-methylase UbiE
MDMANRRAHRVALKGLQITPDDSVLEISFGTGRLVRMFAALAWRGLVAGVDPSSMMCEIARRRNQEAIEAGRVDLRLCDAALLPWRDERFNKVVAIHCFQFWPEPMEVLRGVRRVLRPGGVFLLILRARGPLAGWHELPNPLSREGDQVAAALDALGQSGFDQVEALGRVGGSQVVMARRPEA